MKDNDQREIRGMLMHLGWNMWSDVPVSSWGPFKKPEELSLICAADHVRTDEGVWRRVTERLPKDGFNMIVIDLGEACFYPSHPELAVKGTWSVERMRKELSRLRGLGLEPIPKLNFSTAHDTWLKDYARMVSTETYYRVCADLIRDVKEIFDGPRLFHLGYDEETAGHQAKFSQAIIRSGELWWHDFLWFVGQVERRGMRAWIWSDYYWHHPELFLSRMPKSVLQSNWYYGKKFDFAADDKSAARRWVQTYLDLDRAGYDQVPCGSNWSHDENFPDTVEFARKRLSKDRLKGFLNAPWFFPCPQWEGKLMEASELGRKAWEKTI